MRSHPTTWSVIAGDCSVIEEPLKALALAPVVAVPEGPISESPGPISQER